MKRILICRNGAYGDIIHMTHLPRMLKENGWDYVGVATGFKGHQLLHNNPFIDRIHFWESGGRPVHIHYFHTRTKLLSLAYDKTIDLFHSIEVDALALEDQDEYYQCQDIRYQRGKENYYDISTIKAGYPELCGKYKGEVFYSIEEIDTVKNDLLREGRFKENFKVLMNLSGSSPHKVFLQAKEVAERVLEKYPDAVIFTTGDRDALEMDFKIDRVRHLAGSKPFRQVLLMAKYMNCVIGCESGLMCGASMWDVPTIQLMTAASVYNHCKYSTRDYSLQSPARCSPCYKGPYKYYGCPKTEDGRSPLCVKFDANTILNQIDRIYNEQFIPSKTTATNVPEMPVVR